MRFHIMTLFPEIFNSYMSESIMKRAVEKEIIEVHVYNIRDFTVHKHKKVDD
ncbi:MAG: tRNA (guanosine(37)-N1)-methyltransferase TrmD, partial [Paraclostridium sp.]